MVSKSLSLFDNLNSLTPFSVGYDSIFNRLNDAIEQGQGSSYHLTISERRVNISMKSNLLLQASVRKILTLNLQME